MLSRSLAMEELVGVADQQGKARSRRLFSGGGAQRQVSVFLATKARAATSSRYPSIPQMPCTKEEGGLTYHSSGVSTVSHTTGEL